MLLLFCDVARRVVIFVFCFVFFWGGCLRFAEYSAVVVVLWAIAMCMCSCLSLCFVFVFFCVC